MQLAGLKSGVLYLRVAVGHPLHCETGPGERMRVERVVEERRVLLPDFVLFEDALLFQLIRVVHYNHHRAEKG